MSRRNSKDYTQLSVYIRKNLATKFKTICTANDKEYSETLEEILEKWVEEQESKDKS